MSKAHPCGLINVAVNLKVHGTACFLGYSVHLELVKILVHTK